MTNPRVLKMIARSSKTVEIPDQVLETLLLNAELAFAGMKNPPVDAILPYLRELLGMEPLQGIEDDDNVVCLNRFRRDRLS